MNIALISYENTIKVPNLWEFISKVAIIHKIWLLIAECQKEVRTGVEK